MNSIKIYVNKELRTLGVLITFICIINWCWLAWGFLFAPHEGERPSPFFTFCFLAICALGSFGWFVFWPRWFASITLSKKTITTKLGRKERSESYALYPYVYLADYYHRGFRPCFIVLAKWELFEDELTAINQVPIDENVIKIRYSKETYATLMEILPEPHRSMVKNVVENTGREIY